jgi:hypothetical protein
MNIYDVTVKQLRRAASIKEQIERLNKELSVIFGSPGSFRSAPKTKRTMSASAKKKIAAAQIARWAKLRRTQSATRSLKTPAPPKKKTISLAAKRKLSAKLKAYWAQKKAREK